MATKKTAAKKAAAKTKYYAAPNVGMVDQNGTPLIRAIASSDPEFNKQLDADPGVVEISKKEAAKIDAALEGRFFETLEQQFMAELEDLRGGPSRLNAGDYLWATLLFGAGFVIGAIIL